MIKEIISLKFANKEVLYLVLPFIILLAILVYRKNRSIISSLLRLASIILLCFVIAKPYLEDIEETNSISVAFDVSESINDKAQDALFSMLDNYIQPSTEILLWPFAKDSLTEGIPVKKEELKKTIEEIREKKIKFNLSETNIAQALGNITKKPKSSSLFLLTDGFETAGDSMEVAKNIAQEGISIFPLIPDDRYFKKEDILISNLYTPLVVAANEVAEVRTSVKNTSNNDKKTNLEIFLGDKKLFSQNVVIEAEKEKLFTIKVPSLKELGGLNKLKAVLSSEDLSSKLDEKFRWLSVKENEKILLLSGSEVDEKVLKNLISLKGYSLEARDLSKVELDIENLEHYNTVIVNNSSFKQIGNNFLTKLKEFTEKGGGVLLIGGDKSFGLGGFIDTALEEISPVKFVPPQTEKRRLNNAIVLLIDKSGSMADDNKIFSAKMAALSSIQSLKDEDYVGLIGFDAAPFVVIDPKPVKEAKLEAERRLRNLTAVGKTNLLPALAMARQRLANLQNYRKHIIVLSDGKIPISDYEYIAERDNLRKQGITVSAIALGIEADIPFMRILSQENKGAFHHTLDPSQLPNIFIDDIKIATGEKTVHESMQYPVALGPAEIKSVDYSSYPEVLGFVETLPKKGSNLELITTRNEKVFPILSSWQYGKGKVIAFSSDANGRWSVPWLRWKEFSNFWTEIINQVKNKSNDNKGNVQFDLRYYVDKGNLLLDLAIFDENLKENVSPVIKADLTHSNGKNIKTNFSESKKGRYLAKIENPLAGEYKISIDYGSLKLPELAFELEADLLGEIQGQGLNIELLSKLAYLTKGKINPQPEEVYKNTNKINNKQFLDLPLILLAFVFILLEAFIREGVFRRGK